jgi:integrase
MSLFRRGNVWWYEFWFANRRVRESAKTTSKTLAKAAEQTRRRALETGFNNLEDAREERVRTIREIAAGYLESYRLRNPRSATFAEYAVGHVTRVLGDKMLVDVNEQTVKHYQDARLRENTAPKSINEEVGFLLRLMDTAGDVLRARLRKKSLLKLKTRARIAKAFTPGEKTRLTETAAKARSPHLYPALMLALNTGMRDAVMKNLTWAQIDFEKRYLSVGRSKTEAREGRTIPLNSVLYDALASYAEWYQFRFGELHPEWYVFPYGKPRPNDPTRPVKTLKTAWHNLRKKAGHSGPLARQPAHAHHGPGRERRERSDHHGYRRTRLEANAEALQPHPHGGEACRARIDRSKANRHAEPGKRAEQLATTHICAAGGNGVPTKVPTVVKKLRVKSG